MCHLNVDQHRQCLLSFLSFTCYLKWNLTRQLELTSDHQFRRPTHEHLPQNDWTTRPLLLFLVHSNKFNISVFKLNCSEKEEKLTQIKTITTTAKWFSLQPILVGTARLYFYVWAIAKALSFLKKWAILSLFFVFSNKHYNFYNNFCENYPSSILCWDSNPQPSDCKSYPLTTRPVANLINILRSLITTLELYLTGKYPILWP